MVRMVVRDGYPARAGSAFDELAGQRSAHRALFRRLVELNIAADRAEVECRVWLLIAGTLAAAAAVGTGLYAEPGVMVSRSVRETLLSVHKRCMIATLAVSAALSLWALADRPFPRKGRAVFILLFLLMLALMSFGADYGARLVYDYNAGGNACSQSIDFTK